MKVIDPGHMYELQVLDGTGGSVVVLPYVKREGPGYPGNVGHHPGTIIQEGWRAEIDRLLYLHNQKPHGANLLCVDYLRKCIWLLEYRAAEMHGRPFPPTWEEFYMRYGIAIEKMPTCGICGHILHGGTGCRAHRPE